jgi:hypothetical protein
MADRRVQFAFDVEFSNGGSLKGEGFRLDIEDDDISDLALADYIVRDLRLLMVGTIRIRNKVILTDPHKRSRPRLVDVSHEIEDGMITYRGLPGPVNRDHWTREASRSHFAPGTEFHISRIDMVANTGTYVDSPFHRYADGPDLAALPPRVPGGSAEWWSARPAGRGAGSRSPRSPGSTFEARRCCSTPAGTSTGERIATSKAILSTAAGAEWLARQGAALVGTIP